MSDSHSCTNSLTDSIRKLDGKVAVNRLEPIIPGDIDRLQDRIRTLEAEVERLNSEINWWKCTPCQQIIQERDALAEKLRIATSALEFYANGPLLVRDESTKEMFECHPIEGSVIDKQGIPLRVRDMRPFGTKAREALEKLK